MNRYQTKVQITNKSTNQLPEYKSDGAAGLDIPAFLSSPITLEKNVPTLVPTGLHIALPKGLEGQIRARSGTARKGTIILNAPGTIDSDYRGEIKVLMMNLLDQPFVIKNGDRIAQLVVTSYTSITWEPTKKLPETVRGEGGFGSTGVGD
ncbi:MAG: dUTP diphosphatase [Bacteroidota bacterium]